MIKSKQIAKFSLLITLCLIFSYVEILIPFNFIIPGIKLGLSNIVVLYALYNLDTKSAFCINILRVLLSGMLFSNPITITYSLSGAIFSFFAMILIKKVEKLSIISVSVTGSVWHNFGQILMAYFYLGSNKIIYYLPFLLLFGLITGIIIGYISAIIVERTKNI